MPEETLAAKHFNPRSPQRERHIKSKLKYNSLLFQSTLPAKGATILIGLERKSEGISIHAPRKGSDHIQQVTTHPKKISIHAPRKGSDLIRYQSQAAQAHFNPRSPQRERRLQTGESKLDQQISIHAPRKGSDI